MGVFTLPKGRLVALAGGGVLALSVVLLAVLTGRLAEHRGNQAATDAASTLAQPDANGQSPRRITNRLGMEFVEVPAGRFVMGSLRGGPDARPHLVHITRPFFLGVTEVTTSEEGRIRNAENYFGPNAKPVHVRQRDCSSPINSWREAKELAQTLSFADPDYDYRLPTEAEWEYACRAKLDMLEPSKQDVEVMQLERGEHGAIDRVKAAPPNAFGLYDMLRNNGEYCSDWYSADYYDHSPLEDPQGPPTGRTRVARGVRSEGPDRSYSPWRRYPVGPRADGNILIGVRFVLEEEKAKK